MNRGIFRLDTVVDGVPETKLVLMELFPGGDGAHFCATIGLQYTGRRTAAIRQLFVRPALRRQGIATQLVNACCEIARGAKCEALALTVVRGNEAAEGLYRSMDFWMAYEFEDGSMIFTRSLLGCHKTVPDDLAAVCDLGVSFPGQERWPTQALAVGGEGGDA